MGKKSSSTLRFPELCLISNCLEHVSSTSLTDEDEVASHCSAFQNINHIQKRQLHKHHVQRKRCRLNMRRNIVDAFWAIYEEDAWQCVLDLLTESQYDTILTDAILTVDKNNIVRLFHEKCMMMFPVVEVRVSHQRD